MSNFHKGAMDNDLARNIVLENMSVLALQAESDFVAGRMFPLVQTNNKAFEYFKFKGLNKNSAKLRAPGTPVELADWDVETGAGICKNYATGQKLPAEMVSSHTSAEEAAIRKVARAMLINREVRCADYFKAAAGWIDITGVSGVPTADQVKQYNDAASTPINDMQTLAKRLLKAGARKPNKIVLGADVAIALQNHPTIIGRLNNGQTSGFATASLDYLAQAFGVEEVLVADAVYDTAAEGATENNNYILNSKGIWLGYVNKAPTLWETSAGYRFAWTGHMDNNAEGVRTKKYWSEEVESWIVKSGVDDTIAQVNGSNGLFIASAIA